MKSVFGSALLALLGCWMATLSSGVAQAHGVKLEYQNTQAIQIQAAYDTGEPLAQAQVAVFAPDDPAKPWLTGTTDDQGRFVFTPDEAQTGGWEVQVRQAGHGDIVTIPLSGSTANATASARAAQSQTAGYPYTPLQQAVLVGSVIWGCIGTALYFSRGKNNVKSLSEKS